MVFKNGVVNLIRAYLTLGHIPYFVFYPLNTYSLLNFGVAQRLFYVLCAPPSASSVHLYFDYAFHPVVFLSQSAPKYI